MQEKALVLLLSFLVTMGTIFVVSPAFCYYKNQDGSYVFQQENTERLLAQITPDPHSTAELAQGFFCLKTPSSVAPFFSL